MSEYGMYPSNTDSVRRWMAELENAEARLALARTRECCALLLSQRDPVYSLGVNRDAIRVLLDFVLHHDPARLRRECDALAPPVTDELRDKLADAEARSVRSQNP